MPQDPGLASQNKKICVVGCGYIGLPTAAMFASRGCDVLAVDVAEAVVNSLNKGEILIEEPGLPDLVREVVEAGKLQASLHPNEADAFIVAVPTPNNNDEFRSCDLTYVLEAVKSITPYLKKDNVIIVESTIAPRSLDDFVKPLIEEQGLVIGEDIYLAHCPERVLPGKILQELVENNRIVGGITPKCTEAAADLYKVFVEGEILRTEAKTAELAKCMENTFRDVNIALSNELAQICNELSINCLDVIELANKHPRVNLHAPGPGVGGHCLAIDPYFICAKAPTQARLIALARETNNGMPSYVNDSIQRILRKMGIGKDRAKVAVLGVTYKGNVDDCRESPALEIIDELENDGYMVYPSDPFAHKKGLVSIGEALRNADIAVVLVDHNQYKGNALAEYVSLMRQPVIFDTRNIVSLDDDNSIVINYGNLYQYV